MLIYIVETSFLNEKRIGEHACLTQPRIFTTLIGAVRYIGGKLVRKVVPIKIIKSILEKREKQTNPLCIAIFKSPILLKNYPDKEQYLSIYVAKV